MPSLLFLDKTCTISTNTVTISGGEQINAKSILYTDVACDFYMGVRKRLNQTDLAQRTDKQLYTLILSYESDQVRKGMTAVISFDEFANGEYLIEDVHMMYDHKQKLDHIHCICSSI